MLAANVLKQEASCVVELGVLENSQPSYLLRQRSYCCYLFFTLTFNKCYNACRTSYEKQFTELVLFY